jgi:hypothetical protein
VSWLWLLIAGLLPYRLGFNPRPALEKVLVDEVRIRQGFLRALWFFLVSIVPRMFLAYLLNYSMEQNPSEKLTSFQHFKKFPAFYGTRKFITAVTKCPPPFTKLSHQSILPPPTS